MLKILTTLLLEKLDIIEGLRTGVYVRRGGVVRVAQGVPDGGQIICHLAEAPPSSDDFIVSPKTPLSPLLQVGQIAATASVINLGVTIAGFVYMNHKLDRLQQSVNQIQTLLSRGLAELGGKLDVALEGLHYLLLFAVEGRAEQERLQQAVTELHRTVLFSHLAEMQASWLDLRRFPDSSPREAIKAATKARHVFQEMATRISPTNSPRDILLVDTTIQGWAVATAAEFMLLLKANKADEAMAIAKEAADALRRCGREWAHHLLRSPHSDLSTAYRFGVERFQDKITAERVERIARLSPFDESVSMEAARRRRDEADVELRLSRNTDLDVGWDRSQLAVAEFLDGFSELLERIESMVEFAKLCLEAGQPAENILPKEGAPGEIYILEPKRLPR